MIKKTLFLTILIAAMLAPAASADHGRDRYLREDRLVFLSTDLLETTREMRFDVQRRARARHGRGYALLDDLERLERRARHFRRDALRGASLRHLDRDLDALIVSFERVDRRMDFVRSSRLQRDFRRVDRAMRQLARRVEVASSPVRPHRDRRLHGEVVLGDRGHVGRYKVRVRF